MTHDLARETSYVPRYALVGAVTFCIDVSVFTVLILLWGREYVALATLCGGTCGYFVNFFGHRLFTFRNEEKGKKRYEIPLHATMKFGGQAIRAGLMHFFVIVIGIPIAIAYVVIGAIISLSNFALSRWIFMRQSPVQLIGVFRAFRSLGFRGSVTIFAATVQQEYAALKARLRS